MRAIASLIDTLSTGLPEAGWTAQEWSLFVREAKAAGVLLRVFSEPKPASAPVPNGLTSIKSGLDAHWPAAVNKHIVSLQKVTQAQRAEVFRELGHLRSALGGLGVPLVLLKGAAYLAADLPAAQGRVFSDIDLMVPKSAIDLAEVRLNFYGWASTHHNTYDQRYYRQWMHELPPLQHSQRGTNLDLHHAIMPETARLRPSPQLLLQDAIVAQQAPGFMVLAPADMALHNMVHLFMNEDAGHALRDLSDLDLLLRHFAQEPQFWTRLLARAEQLGLLRALFFGLHFSASVLQTPVPVDLQAELMRLQPRGPSNWLAQRLWSQLMAEPYASQPSWQHNFVQFALFVRGHWLRMPPLLLARHLAAKALRRDTPKSGDQALAPLQPPKPK